MSATKRATDVQESGVMLNPLVGMADMSPLSFDDCIALAAPHVPDLASYAFASESWAANLDPIPHGLTPDEAAALNLYAREWVQTEKSFYYILNQRLRTEDRAALKPFFGYLRLFLGALEKLPVFSLTPTLWRGIRGDVSPAYKVGKRVPWWGVSSCTTDMSILTSFLGEGPKTLFSIHCTHAFDLAPFSVFPGEKEVVLPPGRLFEVLNNFPASPGLTIIELKEVLPKAPLIHFSVGKKIEGLLIPPQESLGEKESGVVKGVVPQQVLVSKALTEKDGAQGVLVKGVVPQQVLVSKALPEKKEDSPQGVPVKEVVPQKVKEVSSTAIQPPGSNLQKEVSSQVQSTQAILNDGVSSQIPQKSVQIPETSAQIPQKSAQSGSSLELDLGPSSSDMLSFEDYETPTSKQETPVAYQTVVIGEDFSCTKCKEKYQWKYEILEGYYELDCGKWAWTLEGWGKKEPYLGRLPYYWLDSWHKIYCRNCKQLFLFTEKKNCILQ